MRADARIGFTIASADIHNWIYNPRYYDPAIEDRLDALALTHELVSLQELIDRGELDLRQGKYIDKMHYGTGPVPYIRTSDIANWELRGSPKHGMSEAVATEYRAQLDVREGDVLLVHEGTYLIGTACLVTRFDTNILFQHHLAKLRVSGSRVTGPLLMACLLAPVVQQQIRARQFTADVIDSIVGRLPEVRLPLHRDPERRAEVTRQSAEALTRRADARARLALLCRELDDALAQGECERLARLVSAAEIQGDAHVAFLGERLGTGSFSIRGSQLKGDVLIPRYYDPVTDTQLRRLESTCDLVPIGELVDQGIIGLQTGDEVGKLAYGSGEVAFVRTSDFGNWELKRDPKQRVSADIYDQYADKQSAHVDDILVVRDGTYLVGSTSIVGEDDLPLLFSGGIYRMRIRPGESITPALMLALLNTNVVRRQMRNKQFTRDVIDTLGHRLREVVLPIPSSDKDRRIIQDAMERLLGVRAEMRRQVAGLGLAVEAA